ncbi:hypothetical protein FACS189445_5250 [Spirochaetia bacterium]|nr:hypothetical protein FACS189445_5250 [Spirochaetia bacterium]
MAAVLTDSVDPAAYWRKLKQRLKEEGNETVTNCHALKLRAPDGKMRLTDVANMQQLFRLIQSIPSLAELSTKQISESNLPVTFDEHAQVAQKGGAVARNARLELEAKTGKKVISPLNAKKGIVPKLEKK